MMKPRKNKKPITDETRVVYVRLTNRMIDTLDRLAGDSLLSTSAMVRIMILENERFQKAYRKR